MMRARDIGPLVRGGRIDAVWHDRRRAVGERAAFDEIYRGAGGDPWCVADQRNDFQQRKYAGILDLLPAGADFAHALDLGCGNGAFTHRLVGPARLVTGVDLSETAVAAARVRYACVAGLSFEQGDLMGLGGSARGFDLITMIDVAYYFEAERAAASLIEALAGLLAPGGYVLLSHFNFFNVDRASVRSGRFHRAFRAAPHLRLVRERRRNFNLTTLLRRTPG